MSNRGRLRGGRGKRSNANGGTSAVQAKDEYHSELIPCCQLIQDATQDIFPEACLLHKNGDTNDKIASTTNKNGKPKAASSSTGADHSKQHQQSIFGLLVRQHLLEKQAPEAASALTTASKKKRKRKKKKGAKENATTPSGESSSQTTATVAPLPAGGEAPLPSATDPPPTSTTTTTISPPSAKPTTTFSTIPTESTNKSTNVDHWLDRIRMGLASPSTCTTTAMDIFSLAENRTLPRFLQYLEGLFHASTASTASSKKNTTPPSVRPTVILADVQAACSAVACGACRQSAFSYLSSTPLISHFQGKDEDDNDELPFRLLLSPASFLIPTASPLSVPTHGQSEYDFERAFDYVAMEEGFMSQPEQPQETLPEESLLVLEKIQTQSPTLVLTTPLTIQRMEHWLTTMLLPCGLPIVENPHAYPLKDGQLNIIQTYVRDVGDHLVELLNHSRHKRQALQMQYEEAMARAESSNFDVQMSTQLQHCDSLCDELLENLASIIHQVTLEYHSWTVPPENWVADPIEDLWGLYNHTISTMLRASTIHEGKVLQLANRPGVVPQMFLSTAHRSSSKALVGEKVEVLVLLQETMEQVLMDPLKDEGPTSLLRKLLAYKEFYALAANEDGKKSRRNDYMDDLDRSCKQLLQRYGELTNTPRCVNVKELLRTQSAKCEAVLEEVEAMNQLLDNEYAAVEGKLAEEPRLRLRLMSDEYPKLMRAHSEADDDPDEDLLDEIEINSRRLHFFRESLEKLTNNVMSRWRCQRTWQIDDTSTPRAPPLRLLKWLRGSDDSEDRTHGSEPCQGGRGKRRVSCILSSLLYRWMVARCDEWHAELTQLELLQAMENDNALDFVETAGGAPQSNGKSSKSGKKSKKKREKKAAVGLGKSTESPKVDKIDNNSEPQRPKEDTGDVPEPHSDTEQEKQEEKEASPLPSPVSPDATAGVTKSHHTRGDKDRPELVIDCVENDSPASDAAKPASGTPSSTQERQLESRLADEPEKMEATVATIEVGIVSATGYQSAESFLVDRLMSVFAEMKRGESSNIMQL